MINKFVLNTVLHHVGLSWIISSNKQMKDDIKENNTYRVNKGPWYNTYICSKLHAAISECCIRNTIAERYNLMCSITALNKLLHTCVDDTNSGDGNKYLRMYPRAALHSLRATLRFIYCWLNSFITIIKIY